MQKFGLIQHFNFYRQVFRPIQFLFGFILIGWCLPNPASANPYPFKEKVWKNKPISNPSLFKRPSFGQKTSEKIKKIDVMRVRIDWDARTEGYSLGKIEQESSGTKALLARSSRFDALGSYQAKLYDLDTKTAIYFQSIGTGKAFRQLVRALTFRFPLIEKPMGFQLLAENPETGVREVVLDEVIRPESIEPSRSIDIETRWLRRSEESRSVLMTIYSEGYMANEKAKFWQDAQKAVRTLEEYKFPEFEKMSFLAAFHPSKERLGKAKDRGMPVKVRDTFLGLDFPYWFKFGRWFHVVYPTSEEKFRHALAAAPYDYPLVLVNNSDYWGVGNYMEHTAVPSGNSRFQYLLLHEMGHFFGLNEEYNSGGPTELAFAPGIDEPWSQNITFLKRPSELKWRRFVSDSTPLPTPQSYWKSGDPVYGAYSGGYAETEPLGHSHIPGKNCIMDRGENFCPICNHAIRSKILSDL